MCVRIQCHMSRILPDQNSPDQNCPPLQSLLLWSSYHAFWPAIKLYPKTPQNPGGFVCVYRAYDAGIMWTLSIFPSTFHKSKQKPQPHDSYCNDILDNMIHFPNPTQTRMYLSIYRIYSSIYLTICLSLYLSIY